MSKDTSKKSDRKYILYIAIIIFAASLTTLVYRVGVSFYERYVTFKEEREKKHQEAMNAANKQQEKQKLDSFNMEYEFLTGTQVKYSVESLIDKAITNNTKNKEHQIEFIFDENNYGKDIDSIKNIKKSLKDFNDFNIQYYEVTLSYGEDGYINRITIETK